MERILLGLVVAWLVLVPAPRAIAAGLWSEADQALIADIEGYLNGLTTVRARFAQDNADGTFDTGIFWLSRPGKARIEYAPPADILVVADGTWLIYFDAELDQVSRVPLDTGPFRFLLAETVSFDAEVEIVGLARSTGLVRLTLADPENPEDGTNTLVFDTTPLELRQWEVVDPQGILTVVTLTEQVVGEPYDNRLFDFPQSARADDFRLGVHR